jgi:hypothetical protein
MTCGDDITTDGQWSGEQSDIDKPPINRAQVGTMAHNHDTGEIHRQYADFTRTSGFFWGPFRGVDHWALA